MKSFSLGKLKDKVGRRFSDPADFDRNSFAPGHRRNSSANVVIVVSESDEQFPVFTRPRASASMSLHSDRAPRSRSRSVSKKQAKELIRHETSQVIQKKLFSLLKDLGLQLPIPLKTSTGALSATPSKSMKIYVANPHDCIYLAPSSSTSFTYEDAENGGSNIPESESSADINGFLDEGPSAPGSTPSSPRLGASEPDLTPPEHLSSAIMSTILKKMKASKSANYLCTQIDSQTSIPHLFAVIVELEKDTSIKTLEVEFSSITKTQWPTADSANRHSSEEKFKIGSLDWDLNFQDADYFINIKNSRDTRLKDVDPQHLAERTREFRLFDARKSSSESLDSSSTPSSHARYSTDSVHSPIPESNADIQKAGLYVFLLPLLLPPNIPATVNTANGTLTHKLSVRVPGANERLTKKFAVKADYNLPMVRTPPSLANSIADKPIYVNRVWNDSLHYSITFPKKYVSLGSEHTINVKLVPMAKDVTVKRIKFNILERVTYVSKDLTREYEFDGDDPFSRSRNSKTKERVVPLCELRTKMKSNYNGLEPFKEEVLSCPENNLLYSCYEKGPATTDFSKVKDKSVMVASPLDINIALPFLTSRSDKEILTSSLSNVEEERKSPSPIPPTRMQSAPRRDSIASLESPSSPIIGSLETHISHLNGGQLFRDAMDEDVLKLDSSSFSPRKYSGRGDSITHGFTSTAKALSPDSNFRHIQIAHRLQVCFRISKPDPADNNKMHHYEVVVDTPIILLSAKCNDGSIQLPEYDGNDTEAIDITQQRPGINFRTPSYVGNGVSIKPFDPSSLEQLPTFEEATSTPSSPVVRSSSIVSLDPGSPPDPPAYENVPMNTVVDTSQEVHTIDDVLISRSPSQRKPSAIRASLQNSFAPTYSPASRVSSNSEASPTDRATLSSGSDVASNIPASDDSSSQSAQSGMGTTTSNDEESSEMFDEMMNITDSTSDVCDMSLGVIDSADAETQSVLTEDFHFDQRIPLLRNESMTGADAHVSKISIRNRGLASNDWSKMSTETLNEESQAQSLFHAY